MKNFFVFLIGALIGAAIVYFFFCKPNADMDGMVNVPKGVITPAQATTLANAFNSRHQLISDSIVKRPDNRSSWYSLKDMRDYLTYAENESKDLGYEMDGIRIYLGAKPDTASEVGYTTMFFVPTGIEATADASMSVLNFNYYSKPPNIPGAPGLDMGTGGNPPGSNYPQ